MSINNLTPEEVEELVQIVLARINADKNKPAAKPKPEEDDDDEHKHRGGLLSRAKK